MYIPRPALKAIGLFDRASFGAGYGEENDFCMRAIRAGWRNLHALDVFVFHSGETSFGAGASAGKQRGYETLLKLHPDYPAQVQRHADTDPARAGRLALDIARAFGRPPRPLTLCFTHALGGGIERHVDERRVALDALGKDLLVAQPAEAGTLLARLLAAGQREIIRPSNIGELHLAEACEPLCAALRQLGIEAIEVHSTAGWSIGILAAIRRVSEQLALPFSLTLHDYIPLCPQITLINDSGRYCGELGPEQCKTCLAKRPRQMRGLHPDWPGATITRWRQRYGEFLEAADRLLAPSNDTAERYQRYFPNLDVDVVPHAHAHDPALRIAYPSLADQPLRIVTLGAIGPHKGSEILRACAEDALARQLPLHFMVVGYTNLPELAHHPRTTVTGPYREDELGPLLAQLRPHLILLPSVWPETFCYTLSAAIDTGLPIAVFDLGAQAERLKGHAAALRLPLDLSLSPGAINDRLIAFLQETGG